MKEKEWVLAIIKPDAVKKRVAGSILHLYEKDPRWSIKGLKWIHLTKQQAEGFYNVHRSRPFFAELVEFMSSGPCIVMALQGEDAVRLHRDFIGHTNPKEAKDGTVRALYGQDIGQNAVHGSDSPENGILEVHYFFPAAEIQ